LDNGMVGAVHLDYFRRPGNNEMEVVGSDGVLHWDNQTGIVTIHKTALPSEQTFQPQEGFERNWLFLDEMRHFIAVTKGEADPSCSLDDGVITEQMVIALKHSWNEKRMIPMAEVKALV